MLNDLYYSVCVTGVGSVDSGVSQLCDVPPVPAFHAPLTQETDTIKTDSCERFIIKLCQVTQQSGCLV